MNAPLCASVPYWLRLLRRVCISLLLPATASAGGPVQTFFVTAPRDGSASEAFEVCRDRFAASPAQRAAPVWDVDRRGNAPDALEAASSACGSLAQDIACSQGQESACGDEALGRGPVQTIPTDPEQLAQPRNGADALVSSLDGLSGRPSDLNIASDTKAAESSVAEAGDALSGQVALAQDVIFDAGLPAEFRGVPLHAATASLPETATLPDLCGNNVVDDRNGTADCDDPQCNSACHSKAVGSDHADLVPVWDRADDDSGNPIHIEFSANYFRSVYDFQFEAFTPDISSKDFGSELAALGTFSFFGPASFKIDGEMEGVRYLALLGVGDSNAFTALAIGHESYEAFRLSCAAGACPLTSVYVDGDDVLAEVIPLSLSGDAWSVGFSLKRFLLLFEYSLVFGTDRFGFEWNGLEGRHDFDTFTMHAVFGTEYRVGPIGARLAMTGYSGGYARSALALEGGISLFL